MSLALKVRQGFAAVWDILLSFGEEHMLKIAAIGLGSRATEYLTIMQLLRKKEVEIVAVCDIAPQVLKDIGDRFNVPENRRYLSADALFAEGKIADGLIIGTQDATHVEIARPAIELGYTILMEKPISGNYAECVDLAKRAEEKGVRIVVCHVLRYWDYYQKVKQIITSGEMGKLVTVNHTENIGYFHFAHSYVRGDWHVEADSTPSLLAKCCHDIDLIQWFFDKPAVSVSSLGSLEYFCAKNAPEGATEFCLGGCPAKKDCVYDAEYHYITSPLHKSTFVKFKKRRLTGKAGATKADIYEALRTGQFGKCVYLHDNDVCDNQTVSIDFGDGQTALHTMTAFSKGCFRSCHYMGTKGELVGRHNDLRLNVFGKYSRKIGRKLGHLPGHGDGDVGLALRFLKILGGEAENLDDVTFIQQTLPSHAIIAAAEISRKENGRRILMEDFYSQSL
ncbi:MAG: Gfo/Idh/MocA family oxidoreductase [Oscillospiraceae bacterium]|jgi:predicted dehydrogenase|nr:Gfo/Idh/MocA family oxidoreductase [Oscillospiraceae bacterium]